MTRGNRLVVAVYVAVLGGALAFGQGSARGQAAWEFTPYEVHVKVSLAPAPQLPVALVPALGEAIASRAEAVLGAVWRVETSTARAGLARQLLIGMDELSVDSIVAGLLHEDVAADKVYLTAIWCASEGIHVAVRELDCRTRQLGPRCERTAPTSAALAPAIWDALLESFTPLVRIEMAEENKIIARLKAGGLIVDPHSPALIEPGATLRPVLRKTDRSGQPVKGGIQPLLWTLLTVGERRDSLLDCTLYSGYRAPIPSRAPARTERLALLVRPRYPSTRLLLRARDNPDKPLVGYEIHLRWPGDEQAHPAGITDDEGAFELARGEAPLVQVYVRHGQQLLGRLPIVPGEEQSVIASLPDDDRRLEAEGFVAALSARALDLVARREILATRIRARLKEGKPAEAQQLLDDFRKLETQAELRRDLDLFRQRCSSSDRLTQARIEKLFTDAQKVLLLKPLSDELVTQLTREVAGARSK
jgi:hypothetical protein